MQIKNMKEGNIGMKNEKVIKKLSRKQLYDEIWELSVAGVARKYNLNYAKLMATCKAENIPFPSSGYWTKKSFGKDVSDEKVELTGSEDEEIALVTNDVIIKHIIENKVEETKAENSDVNIEPPLAVENEPLQEITESDLIQADGILEFLEEKEKNQVLESACNLKINEHTRLHKVLVQYKKDVADYKSKLKKAQQSPYYNPRHKPDKEPEFFKEMSDEGMSRSIAILDVLFKTIEKLGGSVNNDLSMKIRSDIVRIRMAEGQNQVNHELTKQEAAALVKYNDEIKNNHWASKPQIRKYDKVYNGKLRIVFDKNSYIRDSESEKLEDRLGEILITLYEKSEENRIAREEREAAERKREEEARLREEKRQRKKQEIELTLELVNKAEDYRIACEIRSYIKAMIENKNDEVTLEWIKWAEKKADWYDPSVAAEDEYLGKREHGKSKEEKDRTLQNSIKSWYWY